MGVYQSGQLPYAASGGLQVAPAGTASFLYMTAATNAYGSWVEAISSTSAEVAITGIAVATGNAYATLEIGTGAAASETTVAMVPLGSIYVGYIPLYYPVIVAASTRVAVRVAASTGSVSAYVKLQYIATSNILLR